jgi:hypothetical protein
MVPSPSQAIGRGPTATRPKTKWSRGAMAGIAVVLAGCGSTHGAAHSTGARSTVARSSAADSALSSTGTSCTYPAKFSNVWGTPKVPAPPSLESVSLAPQSTGLLVTYTFSKPLVLAPEGVYFSWTVYIFRHRSDAARYNRGVSLQIQDRGAGWEPTGWTVLVSSPSGNATVEGGISTNSKFDRIQMLFPSRGVNLRPPFYWFASEEVYRAYMPQKSKSDPQNYYINGALTTDCPGDIRHDPQSLPKLSRLLFAAR